MLAWVCISVFVCLFEGGRMKRSEEDEWMEDSCHWPFHELDNTITWTILFSLPLSSSLCLCLLCCCCGVLWSLQLYPAAQLRLDTRSLVSEKADERGQRGMLSVSQDERRHRLISQLLDDRTVRLVVWQFKWHRHYRRWRHAPAHDCPRWLECEVDATDLDQTFNH